MPNLISLPPWLFVLFLASIAHADRLYLKSGNDFAVESWREADGMIYYQRFGGTMAVPKEDVLKIESGPALPPTPPNPRPVPFGSPSTGPTAGQEMFRACSPIPWIGEAESRIDSWLGCLGPGFTRKRNMTVMAGGDRTQHVIQYLGHTISYIYTTNGKITAYQSGN